MINVKVIPKGKVKVYDHITNKWEIWDELDYKSTLLSRQFSKKVRKRYVDITLDRVWLSVKNQHLIDYGIAPYISNNSFAWEKTVYLCEEDTEKYIQARLDRMIDTGIKDIIRTYTTIRFYHPYADWYQNYLRQQEALRLNPKPIRRKFY